MNTPPDMSALVTLTEKQSMIADMVADRAGEYW